MSTIDPQYPMRRLPQQPRAWTRVNSILQAASNLFVELGYEETTTNKIATRANIAIGSLYQYYPNKEALMNALSQRYLDELLTLYSVHFSAAQVQAMSIEEMVDGLVDRFVEFDRTQEGAGLNIYGATGSPFQRAVSSYVQAEVVRMMEAILGNRLPSLNGKERMLVAIMFFALVKTIMSITIPDDGIDKDDLIVETKAMLRNYLVKIADGTN